MICALTSTPSLERQRSITHCNFPFLSLFSLVFFFFFFNLSNLLFSLHFTPPGLSSLHFQELVSRNNVSSYCHFSFVYAL
ncbi:hypothetical protein SDJN03_06668, partial [Cucurbita argyrosperma subsp. sororia]